MQMRLKFGECEVLHVVLRDATQLFRFSSPLYFIKGWAYTFMFCLSTLQLGFYFVFCVDILLGKKVDNYLFACLMFFLYWISDLWLSSEGCVPEQFKRITVN